MDRAVQAGASLEGRADVLRQPFNLKAWKMSTIAEKRRTPLFCNLWKPLAYVRDVCTHTLSYMVRCCTGAHGRPNRVLFRH